MKKLIGTAIVTTLLQATAHAEGLESALQDVDFTFGGYGTAGVVRTNTRSAQFVREFDEASGATSSPRVDIDSNIGVQASARFNSWLSATVQVAHGNEAMTDGVTWAYIKVQPLDNLSAKVGKIQMPIFGISDSRDINYSNTWVRPPTEVYGLANIEELKGGELAYSLPIGPTHLTFTGYGGNGKAYVSATTSYNSYDVRGGELRWETNWVTLRASLTTSVNTQLPSISDRYTFAGYGAIVDHDNVIAQAEYVTRRDSQFSQAVDSDGYYLLGGYHFGKITPYLIYADTRHVGASLPAAFLLSGDQSTTSLGVRWDAFKSVDLKFQLDRVDPKGTNGISFIDTSPGFGKSTVTVATLTLDFVF